MAIPQSRLFKEALDLTEKDRAELAGLLIDSLDAEEGNESTQLGFPRWIVVWQHWIKAIRKPFLGKKPKNGS
jgi:hypothetical protein